MLQWLGRVCYRGRWLVLAGALLLITFAGVYGSGAIALLDGNVSHISNTQSDRAQQILDTKLSASRVDILILFQSATLQAQDPAYQQAVTAALATLQNIKDVASVNTFYTTGQPAFISTDGHETYATVRLKNQNDPNNAYSAIKNRVKSSLLRISYGGQLPADQELTDQIASDLGKMEGISFPVVAIALILVFDGLIAAGLPLVVGGIAIVGALAVLRVLVNFMDISVYSVNLVSVLGLGLAIDYALFIVMRFREELAHNDQDVEGAITRTLMTAGRTVLFSGLTVSTCLLSLVAFPLVTLRSLGIGSILAVLVAMLAALTVLPAILSLLGRRINALSLRRMFGAVARRLGMGIQSANASATPLRYLMPVLVMALGVFAALAVPQENVTTFMTVLLIVAGILTAWLSLVSSAVAIGAALTILQVMNHFTGVGSYTTSVIVIIGLGNAIDYALLLSDKYHAYLAQDERNVAGALREAFLGVGRNIFFSVWGVCTILLVLTLLPISANLHSIALGSIFALLWSMVMTLLALPFLLFILRRPVTEFGLGQIYLAVNTRWQQRSVTHHSQGAWYRLSHFVMRYAVPIVFVTVTFLVSLGTPFLHVNFAQPDIRALPTTTSARYVADQITANFPQQAGSQQTIALTTPGNALSPDNLAKLNQYVKSIQAITTVKNVSSVVSLDPHLSLPDYQTIYANPNLNPGVATQASLLANHNATQIVVTVPGNDNSAAAQSVVKQLRALQVPTGINAYVGGATAQQLDLFSGIRAGLPLAVVIIVLSTFVLLFLMTGSVIVPLKAIVLNFLSLTATFGALVFVFQEGHGQQILDFHPLGSIDPSQLMILFALAFGLSMDYEVFLLSRIKEQYDLHGDNQQAVAVGLQRTGGLITSAALLLSIVLFATITSQVIFIKQLGLGLAIAVIMDATVVRALLVPATMRLLGKFNWWPNLRSFGERDEAPTLDATPDQVLTPDLSPSGVA